MRPDRPRFASNNLVDATPEEIKAGFEGYLAYCGSYEVNEGERFIIHHLEFSSFPNWVETDQKRYFKFTGNRLTLKTPPVTVMDEGPVRLSRLSNAQAVGRDTPRAAACLAVVSYPAATNASRISASFEACRAFEAKYNASKLFWLLPRPIVVPGRSKSRLRVQIKAAGRIESVP